MRTFQSDCNLKVKWFWTGTWNFKMGFGLELNIKDRFRTETWNSRQILDWSLELELNIILVETEFRI
ncbi:unnamed protein product [Rhizophagus irregularis]|uniref:Uncharacterized protein n=1 Tax=Rhizophagus irregularis TaxID=588596 RepID=A0A915ZXA7_9GLOM|nr:unnamed protein product [Rhizophagus irregularis]